MTPMRIVGGVPFGAPRDWVEERDGPCGVLFVRREIQDNQLTHVSAWQPTQEEMLAILAGGTIYLRCVGGQPPVALWAEAAPPEDPDPYSAPPQAA